jgi:hypothetical protein
MSDASRAVRRVAHLDMDAFYASVELLRRPDLRGQPVAIGGRGDPTRRGVVTTATYEARAFGIHSGMALSVAARLCPQCVFLPVDFDRYREVSRQFKQALTQVTTAIEDRGIDEVYLDLTEVPGDDRALALRLQAAVFEATGLTCSIGIGPNKLVAKIASDLDKPRGISLVGTDHIAQRLWPLAARKIPGIGPKADARDAADCLSCTQCALSPGAGGALDLYACGAALCCVETGPTGGCESSSAAQAMHLGRSERRGSKTPKGRPAWCNLIGTRTCRVVAPIANAARDPSGKSTDSTKTSTAATRRRVGRRAQLSMKMRVQPERMARTESYIATSMRRVASTTPRR